jgi:two-component system, OmpR family, sensor histidine kinase KdpD
VKRFDPGSAARAAAALLGPAAATGLGLAIGAERTTAAALAYILAVLGVAAIAGLVPGIVASVLSFLGLNFFFTPPRRTFSVAKTDDLIALAVFISVGIVVSGLVALERSQRLRAERRELESRSLYAISSRMLGEGDLDEALADLASALRRLLGLARCEVHVAGADASTVVADGESGGGAVVRIPLTAARGELGMLVLEPGSSPLGEAEHRVAAIFARQTAAAIERRDLEREAREARLSIETNRLRRAILSAVSHDFRTPLASIKAAVTALIPGRGSGTALPLGSEAATELLDTALEETERLERLVANLLDLTRIRSGALSPERVVVSLDEILEDVLAGLRSTLADRPLSISVRPDVPPLDVDPVQVGQVLRNVVENATKFAPARTEIKVTASRWHGSVEVRVSDRGPGIEPESRDKVFDEFYRAGDGRAAGTGLGLAVARALVRANGGEIWIEGAPGGGATVAIRLPAAAGAPS